MIEIKNELIIKRFKRVHEQIRGRESRIYPENHRIDSETL